MWRDSVASRATGQKRNRRPASPHASTSNDVIRTSFQMAPASDTIGGAICEHDEETRLHRQRSGDPLGHEREAGPERRGLQQQHPERSGDHALEPHPQHRHHRRVPVGEHPRRACMSWSAESRLMKPGWRTTAMPRRTRSPPGQRRARRSRDRARVSAHERHPQPGSARVARVRYSVADPHDPQLPRDHAPCASARPGTRRRDPRAVPTPAPTRAGAVADESHETTFDEWRTSGSGPSRRSSVGTCARCGAGSRCPSPIEDR